MLCYLPHISCEFSWDTLSLPCEWIRGSYMSGTQPGHMLKREQMITVMNNGKRAKEIKIISVDNNLTITINLCLLLKL